jgi:hypothetical protein
MLMASTRDGNCERDIIIDYMYDIGYMCGGGVLDVYTLCHSDVVCLEVIYLLRLLQCRIASYHVVLLFYYFCFDPIILSPTLCYPILFYPILSYPILSYLLSYVLITCRIA